MMLSLILLLPAHFRCQSRHFAADYFSHAHFRHFRRLIAAFFSFIYLLLICRRYFAPLSLLPVAFLPSASSPPFLQA